MPVEMPQIELTPEQKALIPFYRYKWRAIAFSTAPIAPHRAKAAVEAGYAAVGKEKPLIIFCPSPFAALKHIIDIQAGNPFGTPLLELNELYFDPYFPEMFSLFYPLVGEDSCRFHSRSKLSESIWKKFYDQYLLAMNAELSQKTITRNQFSQLRQKLSKVCYPLNYVGNYISGKSELWAGAVDFAITVLKVNYALQKWEVIQSLIDECGWIFTFESIAIVCGRPTKISLDSQDNLHAEGEPAVVFADGFSMYFYEGIQLSHKYGATPPQSWSAKGLVNNQLSSALKHILVKNTPYQKIKLRILLGNK